MAKSSLAVQFGPDRGFVTWSTASEGTRLGVVRIDQKVAGPEFTNPNFMIRFSREDELPGFMARRIDVTVAKIMFAVAQLYAEGGDRYAPLTIEGAQLQHGQGNSVRRVIEGKTYLAGTEAAHFGIGTVTRMGEALSVQAARQVLVWRATSGLPEDDPRAQFGANGLLAAYGLAHDAATYLAPAFINRSEGVLETIKQALMI